MDYASLRRRNKKVLVDNAFNLFVHPSENVSNSKDIWVDRLVNGYDFESFIRKLKNKEGGISLEDPVHNNELLGEVTLIDNDINLKAGTSGKVEIKIRNLSDKVWRTEDEYPIFAAYHWNEESGKVYEFDGIRTAIDKLIAPGDQIVQSIHVNAPTLPGNYVLIPTLIIEGQAWLENRGLAVREYAITIPEREGFGMTERAYDIYHRLKSEMQTKPSKEGTSEREASCAL